MKATVLVDNIPHDGLQGEWGLSILIQYGETSILLDTGASGLFLENAAKLGEKLSEVDCAVLSHAHYDHSMGMRAFFAENKTAKFFLREGSAENCYFKKWLIHKYIGLPWHILEEYADRIVYAKGNYPLCPGAWLIPHHTPGLSEAGRRNNLYIRNGKSWQPDDFAHEQSLVLETEEGLVIFNSCSHGGADVIIRETMDAFPEQKIRALIGGFHLAGRPEPEVRALAGRIRETGIGEIYTGHCTGEKAYRILKEELPETVHQLHAGMVIS